MRPSTPRLARAFLILMLVLPQWAQRAHAEDTPDFQLPWSAGEAWVLTGGPHEAQGSNTPWATLNFQPPASGYPGPYPCPENVVLHDWWVHPAAAGSVAVVDSGYAEVDHVGGWRTVYDHLANMSLALGQSVGIQDRLGNPSCVAGRTGAPQGPVLRFGVQKDGDWVDLEGLVFSGWRVIAGNTPFDGRLVSADRVAEVGDIVRKAGSVRAASCDPIIVIDTPSPSANVSGLTRIAGWAIDRAQSNGSGIDAIQLFLDGEVERGGKPIGAPRTRLSRPDVDSALGRVASLAGWDATWDAGAMTTGVHMIYAYARTGCGWTFATRVVVAAPSAPTVITVDEPSGNVSINLGQMMTIRGWAADPGGAGTGVDAVHVYLDGEVGASGTIIGTAAYGQPRPDVASGVGRPSWQNTGFTLTWRVANVTPGDHTLYIYAHSITNGWQHRELRFTVTGVLSTELFQPNRYYPSGATGLTISFPQCDSPYPQAPFGFAIIGVNNGRAFTRNPCLASQFQWARSGRQPPGLYLNLNYPSSTTASAGMTGPAGACTREELSCQAYNYGYAAAESAVSIAHSQAATAQMWWLDVETENTWSYITALNARVIQGAIDYLRGQGFGVGVYSTRYQWGEIAGTANVGLPTWVGGDPSLDRAPSYCSQANSWGGGPVGLVAFSTGPIDGIYVC
ncbi:MAG: hypothetical protein HW416_390 [Chloroflexi bacterium]|nr:hypothetical protein [Chloroflexota bacterium]